MNYAEFQKSLREPHPVYLIVTDQDLLKRAVLELCRNQVEEDARPFDWAVFELEQQSVSDVLSAARTLPWMSSRRWIYVKKAGVGAEALEAYVKAPSPRTVLVLEVDRKPRGWPSLPAVEITEPVDAVRWLVRKARNEGYELEPAAAQALAELVGDDLLKLQSELEKQILRNLQTRRIGLDSVVEMTLHGREYETFALVEKIARRETREALVILNRLFDSGAAAPQILALLYWVFRRLVVAREMLETGKSFHQIVRELKIWSYKNREADLRRQSIAFLERTMIRLQEMDRLSKTTGTDPRLLLERLVVDTCGSGPV